MPRAQTIVQLTDELLEALDLEAARRRVSRSSLIREAVAAFLAESGEAAVGKRIVEGYSRVPPVTPDEWGDLDAERQRATLEALHRLDAEERAGGFPPW